MQKLISIISTLTFLIIHLPQPIFTAHKVTIQELENGWILKNHNGSITVPNLKLPSGVYSALKSLYGDILHSDNDEKLRWIAYENWTYTAEFQITQDDLEHSRRINLTLHGIDTMATVRLNGQVIGHTNNMFVRYSFDILSNDRIKQKNTLEIELQSPIFAAQRYADNLEANKLKYPPKCPPDIFNGVCNRNMLRKMQTSFGADTNLAALSMGIWKPITLEFYDIAIMRDVDIAATKTDTHWIMDIRIFLDSNIKMNFYGNLTLLAPDFDPNPIQFGIRSIKYSSLTESYKYEIPKEKVSEWWPNGYGEQKLYPFVFRMKLFEEKENARFRSGWITQKYLTFGFRTIELVEDKDDHGRTFYFKVNNLPIFIKGAIYLPSHILPEEESHITTTGAERIKHLFTSAKNANMNMIRIWGGGVYGSDVLYNMADSLGLLIWQDLPFTGATYPINNSFIEPVLIEVSQNAKRIAYHSSLALIVTNDEIELYLVKNRTDFGSDAQRLEDEYKSFRSLIKYELNIISRNKPRPGPMFSTPSLGVEEAKTYLPANPQDPNYGDVHFWPDEKDDVWNPDIYPPARFISEYGFQSLPVRISWNRTLGTDDTIVGLMHHRQHDSRNFSALVQVVKQHFPDLNWDEDVDTFIYFTQVAQALAVKTATEVFLSNRADFRTMGALFWHLNDVWIAPTWSSIDYYGNYKLLYYWSKSFLAPISIIALKDNENNAIKVTLIRDGILEPNSFSDENKNLVPRTLNVTINTYLWSELYPQKTIIREEYLGSKTIKQFSLSLDKILIEPFTENNCFVEVTLSETDKIYASNIFFPGNIRDLVGVQDPHLTVEIAHRSLVESAPNNIYIISYSLTLSIQSPALFVYIEIFHPEVRKYELSDNGFLLMEPIRVIHLHFEHDSKELEEKLTMEHVKITTINQFMVESVISPKDTTMTSKSLTETTTEFTINGDLEYLSREN